MFSVAIDGPAGAGKSTIARSAATQLGFIYVDTGALYRAVGLHCIRSGISAEDTQAVADCLEKITVELAFKGTEQRVFLCGADISDDIRSEAVSMMASNVSKLPVVRQLLLGLQRDIASKNNVIMDGRDIGTVVLPNADVKIFLTASPESRAKRRTLQLEQKGETADYDIILEDIKKRDYNDSHREIAPLKPAEGGIIVDTTELTLEQSIKKITEIISGRIE